ncbi:MAG: tetratricopeptide repeat protein [Methylophilaceae bacterium]
MPTQHSFKLAAASILLSLVFSSVALAEKSATAFSAPQTELTGEFVFKYLAGELAGQQGDLTLASQLFLDLAKSSKDSRLAERATKTAIYGKNFPTAIQAADLWAELDPASIEAQQATTQMLIGLGKLNEAKPHLQKLLEKEATRANGFLYLNSLLARHPDKNAVLALVQELAQPYPKLAESHFTMAHAAWTASQDGLALAELDIADQLRPGWEISALLRGQLLFKRSPEATLSFYHKFLDQTPKANDVRLNLVRLLMNQKRFDEAKIELSQLIKSANGNPDTFVAAGLLSFQAENYADSEKYFQQALKANYKDKDQIYLYLGQMAEKQKHEKQALDWYNKVQSGERYLDARIGVANILARSKNIDAAIKVLDEMEGLDTARQIVVIQAKAGLLAQDKRDQEAFDLLDKTVKNLPNTPELVYDYAMAAERVNQLDIAETQLRKIIQFKPDFIQAYNALGYSLADRNIKLEEAKKLIEIALALSPNDHFILDSMGWVQYRLGNLQQSVEYLRQAYNQQADPEIAAHLGEVLWQQGKHDEATKTWDTALQEHPGNEVLMNTKKKFKP